MQNVNHQEDYRSSGNLAHTLHEIGHDLGYY